MSYSHFLLILYKLTIVTYYFTPWIIDAFSVFLTPLFLRCELLNVSGSFYRNKLKYFKFLRKRMNSNPSHGPFHFRAPSKILWRTVRGMIPHKSKRGMEALNRLVQLHTFTTVYTLQLNKFLKYNISNSKNFLTATRLYFS